MTGRHEVICLERRLALQRAGWDDWHIQGSARLRIYWVKWQVHAGCGFNLSTVCLL